MNEMTAEERNTLELYLAERLEPRDTLPDVREAKEGQLSDAGLWRVFSHFGVKEWEPCHLTEEAGCARAVVDAMVRKKYSYKEFICGIGARGIDYGVEMWQDPGGYFIRVMPEYPLAVCLAAKAALEAEE